MMLTNTCPGVRLCATSAPTAFALTESMNVLMTGQRDVRLEQRHAHFAQRLADVVFGDTAAPPQVVNGAGEPGCQVLEHGSFGSDQVKPGREYTDTSLMAPAVTDFPAGRRTPVC